MTRFVKGQAPWNKGLKGTHFSPETEFKPGQNVGCSHPSWKGGVHHMKSDVTYVWTGNKQRARRPRLVYEHFHGPIPKGYCVWHLDGDKDNDNIENLVIMTRADMMRRNAKNHKENQNEITLAG